ncbi:hypothetical protein Y032_0002g834 [Ancylostoma ceylanicum]|uniref:Uncharacterized protein n=1 Tax=Ancylostoma ceylanicum TaxID=53326 RepID=A0A016W3E9_9BILA|nr:hypothetical protein Y032_0002g834 [Ancylostoma ceylanicum]
MRAGSGCLLLPAAENSRATLQQTTRARGGTRRGHSGCLLQCDSGPAGQRHGGKPISCDFPLAREVQQTTRVPASQSRPLSTTVRSSL